MMKISSVEFIKSCLEPRDYPRGENPEIAFVGRSNVGKSSLINTLLHRRIARTSSTPGKTRQIYFYRVNGSFYFVDLPGYGYAKVPKGIKATWTPALEYYLSKRVQLRGVIQLLDARRPPTELDLQMKTWLEHNEILILAVVTKIDKLPHSARTKALQDHRTALGLNPVQTLLPFSAKTGLGRDLLFHSIQNLLSSPATR